MLCVTDGKKDFVITYPYTYLESSKENIARLIFDEHCDRIPFEHLDFNPFHTEFCLDYIGQVKKDLGVEVDPKGNWSHLQVGVGVPSVYSKKFDS